MNDIVTVLVVVVMFAVLGATSGSSMFAYSLRSVGSRTFPLSEHHSEAFGKPDHSVGS
jgi:hypothetical protein